MGRQQRLAQVFVELADTLSDAFDVVDYLQVLTERSVELVGVDAAGLMLDDQRGDLQLVAYTDESARLLEVFELQREEGPCLDCFSSGTPIVNVELAGADGRWPVFARTARSVGFNMSSAIPLRRGPQVIGALNLFTVATTPLDDDVAVAQALADVATIGLLRERALRDQVVLSEQLQTALHSRIVIEQAKGILSAQGGTDVAEAFRLLRTHARRSGQSLTAVADAVIAGSLDATRIRQRIGQNN